MAGLGINANHNFSRKFLAGFAHDIRISQRYGSEDDAGHAARKPMFNGCQITNAAAELHRNGNGPENFLNSLAIDGTAFKGAVEVNEVQPFKALGFEALGLGGGIVIENGGLLHV